MVWNNAYNTFLEDSFDSFSCVFILILIVRVGVIQVLIITEDRSGSCLLAVFSILTWFISDKLDLSLSAGWPTLGGLLRMIFIYLFIYFSSWNLVLSTVFFFFSFQYIFAWLFFQSPFVVLVSLFIVLSKFPILVLYFCSGFLVIKFVCLKLVLPYLPTPARAGYDTRSIF